LYFIDHRSLARKCYTVANFQKPNSDNKIITHIKRLKASKHQKAMNAYLIESCIWLDVSEKLE